jgi:hypothetical protein
MQNWQQQFVTMAIQKQKCFWKLLNVELFLTGVESLYELHPLSEEEWKKSNRTLKNGKVSKLIKV